MGITGAWAVSAHEDAIIAELAPRFLPVIEADRADPVARRRWDAWRRAPLPDFRTWYVTYGGNDYNSPEARAIRSFQELTAASPRVIDACYGSKDDRFFVGEDIWEQQPEMDQMFLSIQSKEYPVAALFHAIGPQRAAQLPGWCGNFLLTSTEVRRSLPRVARALTFSPDERRAVDAQDWLDYLAEEENIIDGPLRIWRWAAAAGLGLCGLALHIY